MEWLIDWLLGTFAVRLIGRFFAGSLMGLFVFLARYLVVAVVAAAFAVDVRLNDRLIDSFG